MNNMKMQVEVDPNEDTEWTDILREKGIIPEKPKSPTAELEEAFEEAIKKQHENRLENKDISELDALEDDEDEEFLNFYKQKRLDELKKLQEKQRFGSVFPVSKNEYEKEVTQASSDCWVLLHMSLLASLQSRLLASLLQMVARKFPEIKVCEITATRCVENYPEANCPTLLVYHKKDVVKQLVTLTALGGSDTNLADVERVLTEVGAVQPSDTRLIINANQDDDGEPLSKSSRLKFTRKAIRDAGSNDSDDDFFD